MNLFFFKSVLYRVSLLWNNSSPQATFHSYTNKVKQNLKLSCLIIKTTSYKTVYNFFNCMFYQLLRVHHSCSSTQSWCSVLPSIVETRDQNSRGNPLLFSNRNLGSFCAEGTEILYTHSLWEVVDHSRSKMHETCLIIIHDPRYEIGPGIEPGTFGLAHECSTTELTLLHNNTLCI